MAQTTNNCQTTNIVPAVKSNCELPSSCQFYNRSAGVLALALNEEENKVVNLNMCSSLTVESFIDFTTHIEYGVVNNGKGKVVDNDLVNLLVSHHDSNVFTCDVEQELFLILSNLFGARGSLSAIYVNSLPFPVKAVKDAVEMTDMTPAQKEVFEIILIKLLSKMGNLRDALGSVILTKTVNHHSSLKTDLYQIFETAGSVSFYTSIIQGINAMTFDKIETAMSLANSVAAIIIKASRDHRSVDSSRVSEIISNVIVASLLVEAGAYAPKSISIENFILSAKVAALAKNATLLTAAIDRPLGSFDVNEIDLINIDDVDFCIDVFNRALSSNNYVTVKPVKKILDKYSIYDIPNTVCDVNSKLVVGNFHTQNSALAHYRADTSCNVLFTESRVIDKFIASMIDASAVMYSDAAIKGLLSVLTVLEDGKVVGDSNVYLMNIDLNDVEILAFAVHPTVRFDLTEPSKPVLFWNITDDLIKLQRTEMFEQYFTTSIGTVLAVSGRPADNRKIEMLGLKTVSEKLNGQIADTRKVAFRDVVDVSTEGTFNYAGTDFDYKINLADILSKCHPESTKFHINEYVRNALAAYETIKSIPAAVASCQDTDEELDEAYVLRRNLVIEGFEESYDKLVIEKLLSTSQGKYLFESVNKELSRLVFARIKMSAVDVTAFNYSMTQTGVARRIVLDFYKSLLV